jgi:putative ABC transport system substrate-binding protein
MQRREFLSVVGAAVAWPLSAAAQQPTPVIGFLIGAGSPAAFADRIAAFREGLKDTGFVEGHNVAFDFRWGGEAYDRIPALAAALVGRRVNVIVAGGGAAHPAKAATTTIPIVALSGGDPIKSGLVTSLNRPEGNITGVSLLTFSLGAKRFELLRQVIPDGSTIAMLTNPSNPDPETKADAREVETAARGFGQRLLVVTASKQDDFEPAFGTMVREGARGLLVMADPFFNNNRNTLIALAARNAMPAIYEWGETAKDGGLMGYGSSLQDAYRHLGSYSGKILNGAKPADLPIMQAVKVELVLNLKTAKALGITFPLPLLGRADEVIE